VTKDLIAFSPPDVSALAMSLRGQLEGRQTPPGHVEMLNMLARAVGRRNFQHLRADAKAQAALEAAPHVGPDPAPADHQLVMRAARYFDAQGRLAQWPARTSLQILCLWGLWHQLPSGVEMTEQQISVRLAALNGFGDHATLRRVLCNAGLVWRTDDCRQYRRVEQEPTPEGRALIRHLKGRGRG
jgi:hypothetical protein